MKLEPIPFVEETTMDFKRVGLIAVNGKRELLLLGGYWGNDVSTDEIWKFNFVTKTWSKEGKLLKSRANAAAVPIEG